MFRGFPENSASRFAIERGALNGIWIQAAPQWIKAAVRQRTPARILGVVSEDPFSDSGEVEHADFSDTDFLGSGIGPDLGKSR